MNKHDDCVDALINLDLGEVEARIMAQTPQQKAAMFAQMYGGSRRSAQMQVPAMPKEQPRATIKEIDGWVHEWECSQCGASLTVGVTATELPLIAPSIKCCPMCAAGNPGDLIQTRVIYTEALAEVMKYVTKAQKIPAIKELRDHRKRNGGDSSLAQCKLEVEEMMAEYNDIKGRKD